MILGFSCIIIYLIFIKWIVIEFKTWEKFKIKNKKKQKNNKDLFDDYDDYIIQLFSKKLKLLPKYFSKLNKYLLILIITILISTTIVIYYFSNNVTYVDNNNNNNKTIINKDEIINNFNELYNFNIMNYQIFNNLKIKKIETNYYEYNNEKLINSNIIDISKKNISKSGFLNISSIENFLIDWQNNENKNSTFCFCPIFLGIINNNILFMFNETNKKWLFLINYKFIEEKEKNIKSKIIFNNHHLQKFYSNFKLDSFIIHSKNSILEYEEFNNTKIQKSIYLNDISCLLHCRNLNKDLLI